MSEAPQTHLEATPETIRQFMRVKVVFAKAILATAVASRVASYVTNIYPDVRVTYNAPDGRQIVLEYTERKRGVGSGDGDRADAAGGDAEGDGDQAPPPDPRLVLEETKRALESLPDADYQMLTYQVF